MDAAVNFFLLVLNQGSVVGVLTITCIALFFLYLRALNELTAERTKIYDVVERYQAGAISQNEAWRTVVESMMKK